MKHATYDIWFVRCFENHCLPDSDSFDASGGAHAPVTPAAASGDGARSYRFGPSSCFIPAPAIAHSIRVASVDGPGAVEMMGGAHSQQNT